ncbi:hypothetical protein QTO34_015451 [Cnephaeus nilssonii]|uniref:Uncharacterized protein n=1 Tax=Cnephaeus nilssonii TaxID=3371016 RepID=A0AA40I461_CNENI|nr:hypothetical protein QTO34_015451 [Eptesicus nilssonii]
MWSICNEEVLEKEAQKPDWKLSPYFMVRAYSDATQNAHSSATASVMYTVVTPMLNPFIYSLRNNDIKRALGRFLGSSATPQDILSRVSMSLDIRVSQIAPAGPVWDQSHRADVQLFLALFLSSFPPSGAGVDLLPTQCYCASQSPKRTMTPILQAGGSTEHQ